ncbi:phosphatidate cytidylyltransferase [Gemella sp. 19428wG2_WT2a]|nr:phosphatidate cytidylyltransferase [Gemella sp. 19428wG2_WT2a]TFU60450.1 phosphatidate cytidylyltransferase [Gemella sp. WT2a]
MKVRIITAIVAITAFIPFLILGGNYFLFATIILSALSVYEITKICFSYINKSVLLLANLFVISIFFKNHMEYSTWLIIFLSIVFLLLAEIIISSHKVKIVDISTVLFLSGYVSVGFYSLYSIRILDILWVLFLLLTIWVTDSLAYFGGMKFGKRKLSVNISPNKSIEGSLIGTMSALFVAIIFYLFTNVFNNIFVAMIVTLLVSIVGQMGDLIESAYKREYGVKDSSNLLPGHGGILDRFDSIILSAPMLFVLLEFIN